MERKNANIYSLDRIIYNFHLNIYFIGKIKDDYNGKYKRHPYETDRLLFCHVILNI